MSVPILLHIQTSYFFSRNILHLNVMNNTTQVVINVPLLSHHLRTYHNRGSCGIFIHLLPMNTRSLWDLNQSLSAFKFVNYVSETRKIHRRDLNNNS